MLPAAADQISLPHTPTEPAEAALPQPVDLDQLAEEQGPQNVVPPPPLVRRNVPAVTTDTPVVVRKQGGRGWMATALVTGLVATVLLFLISAWRFFPERLPEQLRADTLLNLSPPSPSPVPAEPEPKSKPVPKATPMPFDE